MHNASQHAAQHSTEHHSARSSISKINVEWPHMQDGNQPLAPPQPQSHPQSHKPPGSTSSYGRVTWMVKLVGAPAIACDMPDPKQRQFFASVSSARTLRRSGQPRTGYPARRILRPYSPAISGVKLASYMPCMHRRRVGLSQLSCSGVHTPEPNPCSLRARAVSYKRIAGQCSLWSAAPEMVSPFWNWIYHGQCSARAASVQGQICEYSDHGIALKEGRTFPVSTMRASKSTFSVCASSTCAATPPSAGQLSPN